MIIMKKTDGPGGCRNQLLIAEICPEKTERGDGMKKAPLKKRISYWFDNRMSGGSAGLIRLLAIVSLAIILVIAVVIFLCGLNEEGGFLAAFWDSFSTVINAWMPSFEDGGLGYLILMSAAAIVGLFITSVLIGIVSSAIEEKINDLKRGTSEVIEEGHVVVLGFYPGEYTLLQQLVLAAAGRPDCVVVVDDMEQEEMQQYIRENVEAPKNFRIICRTADIFDPKALERCAVANCRSVIISPTDDFRTTKALLAVSTIIHAAENEKVRVGAIVSRAEYRFPPSIAARHNVTTLQTKETIAKIIARSCMEPGLSETFREIFNFEGSELYLIDLPEAEGLTFGELTVRLDRAVPVGVFRNGSTTINPSPETRFGKEDRLLIFSEEKDRAVIRPVQELPEIRMERKNIPELPGSVTIIGGDESLYTVLQELPEHVMKVTLARIREEYREEVLRIGEERDFTVSFYDKNLLKTGALTELAKTSEHVVVLSDYEKEDDAADMDSIFLILNLRDIRTRLDLHFNITAEMRREHNQNLLISDDHTDFVVASNMSSLLLAQLSEGPELISAFREILSNKGNELYLKEAEKMQLAGRRSVAELRMAVLQQGYVLIGCLFAESGESVFNPPLEDEIDLGEKDQLIVIGEE